MESNAVDRTGEHSGRGKFGRKRKAFGLDRVEFQVVMGHSSANVSQAVRDVALNGRESSGVQRQSWVSSAQR